MDEQSGRIQFTDDQRTKVLKSFKSKCNKCQCCLKGVKFNVDHIRPLANGGTNDLKNLQPLCKQGKDNV